MSEHESHSWQLLQVSEVSTCKALWFNQNHLTPLLGFHREITELHKAKATHASETQKAALTAEMQAKEELKVTLEDFQVMARRQQEALVTQVRNEGAIAPKDLRLFLNVTHLSFYADWRYAAKYVSHGERTGKTGGCS